MDSTLPTSEVSDTQDVEEESKQISEGNLVGLVSEAQNNTTEQQAEENSLATNGLHPQFKFEKGESFGRTSLFSGPRVHAQPKSENN